MTAGLGFQGGVVGLGEETEWGTKVAVTKFIALNSDGLGKDIDRPHSGCIPAIYQDDSEYINGDIVCSGNLGFEMRFEGMEVLLKHAMGSVSSAETASFIITLNTNDYIDFIEEAGSELSAQLTAGTYVLGASSAVAGSLCALIKTQMEAVGDGTYTVTHNTATHILTIAVGGAKATFKMLGSTGTNTAKSALVTLGYANTLQTLAASQVAGTAVIPVYTHTFTLADALPTGLSMEIDRDVTAFTYEGCKINTLGLSIDPAGYLMADIGVVAEDETMAAATSQTLPTVELINFTHGALSYAEASASITKAAFTLNNNIKTDRRFIGSRLISQPQRSGKIEVTGNFTIEFESTDAYADFIAATSRALVLTFTSATLIKTGHYRTLTITFPIIKLTGTTPKVNDKGIIYLECPFKAYATDSSTREFNITLKNTVVSVSA